MIELPRQNLGSTSHWRRQCLAVVRLEWKRNLFAPRGLWTFGLAFAPVLVVLLHTGIEHMRGAVCTVEHDATLLAWVLLLFQLRVAIYFGILGIFVQSFRGEMVDKTLHYALIAPLRREWLVTAKFLAASLGGAAAFSVGVIGCFVVLMVHHGADGLDAVRRGLGSFPLGAYLGITLLACIGYGAVFLVLSRAFRNPVIPAVVYFAWESVSAMLPRALQLLSVTYYLKPLFPIELPIVGISGLLTAVVEPIPPVWAVLGLVLVSLGAVTTVALSFRRVEIDAGE